MKTIPPSIFQFLGTTTNGDIGPYTTYRSRRGKLVFFPKTWPKDPATYNQNLNRARWRHAAARWQALHPDTKTLWRVLGIRNNLTISGFNLFMHYILGKGTATVETCQRRARIDVITPTGPPIPYLTA